MKEGQNDIYYITGAPLDESRHKCRGIRLDVLETIVLQPDQVRASRRYLPLLSWRPCERRASRCLNAKPPESTLYAA